MTRTELIAELKQAGIKVNTRMSKTELEALLPKKVSSRSKITIIAFAVIIIIGALGLYL